MIRETWRSAASPVLSLQASECPGRHYCCIFRARIQKSDVKGYHFGFLSNHPPGKPDYPGDLCRHEPDSVDLKPMGVAISIDWSVCWPASIR